MQTDVLESRTSTRMFIGPNEPKNQIHMDYGMTVNWFDEPAII